MRENKLSADDISRVEAGLSHMTHVHCAWKYEAQGVTAAQMNLFYGMAVIALDGAAFVEQYREGRLRDPRILDFIGRVDARVDPEIEAMGPAFRHAARVKIETRDKRTFAREILHRRGSPENPLKPADIEYKFRNVAKGCLSQKKIERVVEFCKTLDRQADLRGLIAILAAPPGEQ
jgi:2-methylcitrate dehydratase PrpD